MWFDHAERGKIRTNGKHAFEATVTAYTDSWKDGMMLLSFVGPATSVDAIRANVSMGKPLNLQTPRPKDAPRMINTKYGYSYQTEWDEHSLTTKDQRYTLFKQRLFNVAQDHYILVNRVLFEPNVNGEFVYAWGEIETPREEVIGAMLRRVTPLAVFPAFYGYLVQRATEDVQSYHHKVSRLSPLGGTQTWQIKLGTHWEQWLSEGLQSGAIRMPADV